MCLSYPEHLDSGAFSLEDNTLMIEGHVQTRSKPPPVLFPPIGQFGPRGHRRASAERISCVNVHHQDSAKE